MRFRPNPPRMVTVVLSLGLLALGLIAHFVPGAEVAALLGELDLPADVRNLALDFVNHELFAYACMAAAPVLLIIGSLVKDV